MDLQTWHGVLEGHYSLLNKHMETIRLMQQSLQDGSDAVQVLQSCVDQTDTALQTFKVAAYRFMAELHQQPVPVKENTPPVIGGVVGPTPAEQVQHIHNKRRALVPTKRNVGAEETTSEPPSGSFAGRPSKRPRTAVTRGSGAEVAPTSDFAASPQPRGATIEEDLEGENDDDSNGPKNTDRPNGDGGVDDNGEDDDTAYLDAVEARLKEKEEKMWKRMVRKRKRSLDDVDGGLQEHIKAAPPPTRLRKRGSLAASQVGGGSIEESPLKSPSVRQWNDLSNRDRARVKQNSPRDGVKKRGVSKNKVVSTG